MAQFIVQGRLKLLLNSDGEFGTKNPVHCKLNCGSTSSGLLGFWDFYSIYSVNLNENNARRNRHSRRVRVYASSKSNSKKSVDENVEYRPKLRDERFTNGDDRCDRDEFDDDDDDDDDDLSSFRGLVVDVSYRPVNVVCWKRAICLEFMEKADVLEYYDQTVNSPSGSFNIPAVLRLEIVASIQIKGLRKQSLFYTGVPHLLQVRKRKRIKNTLSRKNIFYRDDYTCQYCKATNNLTIDHVIPIARGGKWEWENLVTACAKCNSKKGQKTLEEANMKLSKVPKAPKEYDILAIPLTSSAIRMMRIRGTPQEWREYLPK